LPIVVKSRFFLFVIWLFVAAYPCRAQWLTQSIDLKPGWNAVFLHVDASYGTLDAQVGADAGNPIIEIWRWNPPATTQFSDNPQTPIATSEWVSWVRSQPGSGLQRLAGDAAYLVRVLTNLQTYSWKVKGRPVPPRHEWTVTGLNFVGFPTMPANPPRFDAFLGQAPELQSANPEIYYYPGGELSSNNPIRLAPSLFRATPVKRGQAFWIRSGTVFNRYFGPFEVVVNSASGVDFRNNASAYSLRLRNLSTNSLTVNLQLALSEAPPPGGSNIVAAPPLLIRGTLNTSTLTYGYTNLPAGAARSWTLAARDLPGAEVEVVLGLNRSAITANPGELLAGILRFTDSLGFCQVDVPVAATAASSAGLWLGGASVDQVRHYLKSYERDSSDTPVTSSNGNYVVSGVDTSLGGVPRALPLRLIVHNPASGNAKLLQHVFYGLDASTNLIVSLGESALAAAYRKDARRISAVHLPWTPTNTPWTFNGRLREQTNLTASVQVGYNDRAANPFLHSYHPDHDNLDATFKRILPQGSESYSVQREITLNVTPPTDDFSALVAAGLTINGDYAEIITIKGLARAGGTFDTRQFEIRGSFSLNRVNDTPTLTYAP